MELEILKTKKDTPTIMSIILKKTPFDFRAGSYMVFQLDVQDPKGNFRDFSLASSPTEDFLMISSRMSGSPYKNKLQTLKEGDKINVKGPFGHFFLYPEREAVMIAGGIGITPFRSMIKYATDKKLPTKITLFYSNRIPEEIAYIEDLEYWEEENNNLKVINTITNLQDSKESWNGLTGFINEEMIKNNIKDFNNKWFYICGPPAMVDAMFNLLKQIGVREEDIRVEHFTGY